jgi:hypothetical protein
VSGFQGLSGTQVSVGAALIQGWWLVRAAEQGGDRLPVVAGPFPDRTEAGWAALALGLDPAGVRAMYGASRPDGTLARRTSPQELSWLAHLGGQLDRLGEDWDDVLSDTDALTTLLVELTAALVEAGLPVHDCAGRGDGAPEAGGVCLTPAPDREGVVVSWRQHDRMSVEQVRGAAADAAVQDAMNRAVATVLGVLGYPVTPLAGGSGSLVRCEERAI